MTVTTPALNAEIVIQPDVEFKPKRTVLIPVDESKNSVHSIDHSMSKILNPETDLVILLHARTMSSYDVVASISHSSAMQMNYSKYVKEEHNYSIQLLQTLAKKLTANKYHVKAVTCSGDARTVIDNQIESIHPDFVVMASHGKGMVAKALLGSVSQHVLHQSKVPVIIVPFHSQ